VAAYDRAQMYSGLGAGSIGVDLWCYTDAAPEQFHKVRYLRTPQETGWGMTTWDRQDKPLAREFKKFSQIVGRLDLTGISPAPADVAIVIPDEWANVQAVPFPFRSRLGSEQWSWFARPLWLGPRQQVSISNVRAYLQIPALVPLHLWTSPDQVERDGDQALAG